jgi:hypothetical protein
MNSGNRSHAIGKSAWFNMQLKKAHQTPCCFLLGIIQQTFRKCQYIPCWKVLSHVSDYPSVMMRTWSVCRSTILTSKALHTHLSTWRGQHPFFHCTNLYTWIKQQWDFRLTRPSPPLIPVSLWICQPRVGTWSLYDSLQHSIVKDTPKDWLVVALWWVLRFFISATI